MTIEPGVLLQTRVPSAVSAWVNRQARAEGLKPATWIRQLLIREMGDGSDRLSRIEQRLTALETVSKRAPDDGGIFG
jgi:hypothetical protein